MKVLSIKEPFASLIKEQKSLLKREVGGQIIVVKSIFTQVSVLLLVNVLLIKIFLN